MNAKFALLLIGAICAQLGDSGAQQLPGSILWSTNLANGEIMNSPALGQDGTIYIAVRTGLYAFEDEVSWVSNKWFFPAPVYNSSPAVGADGTIYLPAYQHFYALAPDGSMKWDLSLPDTTVGAPAIGFDNTIYFQDQASVYAVSAPGIIKWTRPYGNHGVNGGFDCTGPCIAPDGTIYVCSSDYGLVALTSAGDQKWTFPLANGLAPAIGADGTIYAGDYNGLHAVAPNGTLRWQTPFEASSSPVIGRDGTIYVGDRYWTRLAAVRSTGELLWSILPIPTWHTPPPNTPAIDSGGIIYNALSNSMFAVKTDGTIPWVFQSGLYFGAGQYAVQGTIVAPTIAPNGTIYVPVLTWLYAIAGTNGPGNTPWPLYRQNARHTGKVEKPSLLNPQKSSDGYFQFQIYGQLGQTFTLQGSTNLQEWSDVTNIVSGSVPMPVTDFGATNFSTRFYRVLGQ